MKTFITFLRKEFLEQLRSKKLMIIGLVFVFFGILNPLTAKITPMILKMVSEMVENSGIIVTDVEITALDSWMQFYKNLPTLLIIFILVESSIFSKEYQKGTLTLVLTKGFERYKVVLAKLITLVSIWTVGYIICFAITYVYNGYYWDNSIANNLLVSSLYWLVFALFVIVLFTLFAVNFENSGISLLFTGGVVLVLYLISLLPTVDKYLPIILSDGYSLIYSLSEVSYYIFGLIVTLLSIVILLVLSVITFNKKKI